jgi:hypothetical protein
MASITSLVLTFCYMYDVCFPHDTATMYRQFVHEFRTKFPCIQQILEERVFSVLSVTHALEGLFNLVRFFFF